MTQQLLALKYPDRAESLEDYDRYRVFLDHWQPLITELSKMRRALYARRDSRILGIYAPQGSGKTLFARRLQSDILQKESVINSENLWHRIAEEHKADGTTGIASVNNLKVLLRDAGTDTAWLPDLRSYLNQNENRAIVILDEADQAYLQLRLLEMSMSDFLAFPHPERLLVASAEKFVKECRTVLHGALFILLSNKRDFLESFSTAINNQHHGMMVVAEMPPANALTKEKVVRINTNRLNDFTYWYCINNATPVRKSAIYNALNGAGTFPAAFEAVDAAVSDADQTRTGRPAIKNSLTLCVFYEDADISELYKHLGLEFTVEFSSPECTINKWTNGWAHFAFGKTNLQSALMLESEWNLRVILISPPLLGALLSPTPDVAALKLVFDRLFAAPSPYLAAPKIARISADRSAVLTAICQSAPPVASNFWSAGQARSAVYERALKGIYSTYDTGSTPIPGFRPDLLVTPYDECSVVRVGCDDSDKITPAIRREANFVEFTATQKVTKASVVLYLGDKLKNYVKLMEGV